MKTYSVGLGFDAHKFSQSKKALILGGVTISAGISLEAVSDGDLLLHAICDAICGAAGLGDIGDYFPPDSGKSKDLDSREIVYFVLKKIGGCWRIANIDLTIVTDKPPLAEHKPAIIRSLSKILATQDINLKVKSKEGLDILGSKDGMSCLASVLLQRKNEPANI